MGKLQVPHSQVRVSLSFDKLTVRIELLLGEPTTYTVAVFLYGDNIQGSPLIISTGPPDCSRSLIAYTELSENNISQQNLGSKEETGYKREGPQNLNLEETGHAEKSRNPGSSTPCNSPVGNNDNEKCASFQMKTQDFILFH